jgi:hypothetical protein
MVPQGTTLILVEKIVINNYKCITITNTWVGMDKI